MTMTIPEHQQNMDIIRLHLAQTVADQDAELQRLRVENATLRQALHTHGHEAARLLLLPELALQAAELLQEYCEELKIGHAGSGEWPAGEEGAKTVYEHDMLVAQRLREAIASLTTNSPSTREPDGYAYEYPFEIGGTVIRRNNGQEVNGSRPLRSIPYWYGEPPAPAVPDDVMRELKWAVEDSNCGQRTMALLLRMHELLV